MTNRLKVVEIVLSCLVALWEQFYFSWIINTCRKLLIECSLYRRKKWQILDFLSCRCKYKATGGWWRFVSADSWRHGQTATLQGRLHQLRPTRARHQQGILGLCDVALRTYSYLIPRGLEQSSCLPNPHPFHLLFLPTLTLLTRKFSTPRISEAYRPKSFHQRSLRIMDVSISSTLDTNSREKAWNRSFSSILCQVRLVMVSWVLGWAQFGLLNKVFIS